MRPLNCSRRVGPSGGGATAPGAQGQCSLSRRGRAGPAPPCKAPPTLLPPLWAAGRPARLRSHVERVRGGRLQWPHLSPPTLFCASLEGRCPSRSAWLGAGQMGGWLSSPSVLMNARNTQPLELNPSHKYGDFFPWWREVRQADNGIAVSTPQLRLSMSRIEMRAGSHPLGLEPLKAHCSSLCSSGR